MCFYDEMSEFQGWTGILAYQAFSEWAGAL